MSLGARIVVLFCFTLLLAPATARAQVAFCSWVGGGTTSVNGVAYTHPGYVSCELQGGGTYVGGVSGGGGGGGEMGGEGGGGDGFVGIPVSEGTTVYPAQKKIVTNQINCTADFGQPEYYASMYLLGAPTTAVGTNIKLYGGNGSIWAATIINKQQNPKVMITGSNCSG